MRLWARERRGAGMDPALASMAAEELVLEAQKKRAQTLHDGVIGSIKSDPALSARLLHSWIRADDLGGVTRVQRCERYRRSE